MREFPAFLIGMLVGGIIALLFAPLSGEELRARMGQEAEAGRQKLMEEYQEAMQELQDRMDAMYQDLVEKIEGGEQEKAGEAA
jgi:gas vesicle protein